jgi:hypothetical protein
MLLILLTIPFLSAGQENLYGQWSGKMLSSNGPYDFTLTIAPQVEKLNFEGKLSNKDRSGCGVVGYVQARAIHNRSGEPELMNLVGMVFSDQSIYFAEEGNKWSLIKTNDSYSSLQFTVKWEGSNAMLDGHWQEYETYRRYRKGRLVLKKQKSKA